MSIRASVHGRCGKAPKQHVTKGDTLMASASLAVDVTPAKVEHEEMVWIRILAFGRVAEQLLKHEKGQLMSCSGRLDLNRWTPAEGAEERADWQLVAEDIHSSITVRPGAGKRRER